MLQKTTVEENDCLTRYLSWASYLKALVPLLVPLFISAFRRADELAVAMECRCYHGGEGRTKLRQLRFAPRDYAALLLGLALCVGVWLLGRLGL